MRDVLNVSAEYRADGCMRSVSVCMPVYNAAPYLAAALDSVLAQTYSDIEVIAVDDGSTDGSPDVLAAYEGRVRSIRQQNRGQCAACNRALAEATGDLIKFFDADDVMAPEMIASQVARLGDRRDAVAMGEWTRFYGDLPDDEAVASLPMYRDSTPTDWLAAEWMNARPMMQCGLWLIPRGVLDRAGLWDERLSLINDFEFFTRVLTSAAEILYTPGARLYYRSAVPGSLSGRKSRAAIESQFLSLMLGTSHLLAAEDSPRTRRACANVLQSFDYEHYPLHPDLRAKARARVAELGGSDLEPAGPPRFHSLRRVVGWRAARRVQRAFGR